MRKILLATLIAACPAIAHAQMVVIGNGAPQACYMSAMTGDMGSLTAIRTCTEAIDSTMVRSDEAATYVNRGVLLMRRGDNDKAIKDYRKAIKLQPKLAEAYINHGVALFYEGDNDASLAAYNTAIALDTDKMALTLFNRALVHERMENPKAAYYDLKAALELKPDWEQAQKSLERFTVKRRDS